MKKKSDHIFFIEYQNFYKNKEFVETIKYLYLQRHLIVSLGSLLVERTHTIKRTAYPLTTGTHTIKRTAYPLTTGKYNQTYCIPPHYR